MATNTYVALDKITLGTTTTSVTFNSIPATYTDLIMVANLSAAAITYSSIRFNGDTGTNYSLTDLYGTGSGAVSSRQSNVTSGGASSTEGSGTTLIYQINNYSNTTTYKTALARNSNSSNNVVASVSLWRNTAAINSITLFTGTGTGWAVGSTFSLYGIKAQVVPGTAKATGGTITYDAYGNVIHTFTSSGTFTPSVALSCDYLVVAGGGGGGQFGPGGGGGGGGYLTGTGLSVAATGYSITVGGAGSVGSAGTNSIFSSITSAGGGAGASVNAVGGNGGDRKSVV